MENKDWNYKIGGNLRGLIPCLFLLALFGGISVWLYQIDNGAYLFTMIFTAFVAAILIAVFYRALFVKVLIYDDGFYHQTKPGRGKYYKYNEIRKAWVSSGKASTGANNFFCNYKTYDGQVVKFSFFLDESDGVDYLIECVGGKSPDINNDSEIHQINGKQYGISYIIISIVIFIVFSLINIPMFFNEVSANRWFGTCFFAAVILLTLSVVVKLVNRYFFYKVNIEHDRFYLRTNPFNGKYYAYTDIKSCREVLRVVRHGRFNKGSNHRSYYYFFIFTDITGKTRKFLFQKDMHQHEIDVLKERITLCNNGEVTEDTSDGSNVIVVYIVRIILFAFIVGMILFFGYLSKNNIKIPFFKPSQSQSTVSQTTVPHFSEVHDALSKRGFETANIPTTYWFIEENKLANVVSGIKDEMAFEFYEYTDGETVDLVFNQISYDLSQEMEPDERDKHITELPDGNKIFTLTENNSYRVVLYQANTLIYAYSTEDSSEIQDILKEFGYIKKE